MSACNCVAGLFLQSGVQTHETNATSPPCNHFIMDYMYARSKRAKLMGTDVSGVCKPILTSITHRSLCSCTDNKNIDYDNQLATQIARSRFA